MPTYAFKCGSDEHGDAPREFVAMIHHMPKKIVTQWKCPCGAIAQRDLASEIPTQAVVGVTSISHSTTVGGALSKELEFGFGRFKTNPDGSVEKNHRPFRDTGEMSKYMNGQNDLGTPVVKDNGQVMRRKDGSVVRNGAKLFKYGPNATPSRDGVRRQSIPVPDAWTTPGEDSRFNSVSGATGYAPISRAPVHHSPERKR